MSKILFINPNKWGRGITHIWIASHSGILKRNNHDVELFDSTFYSNWSLNEVQFQTDNKMYFMRVLYRYLFMDVRFYTHSDSKYKI